MKKFSFTSTVLALTLGLGLSAPATAAPVQWTTASGGNDHWYELVWPRQGKISASTAKSLAESSTYLGASGYLATITSAAEQVFLNGLNGAFAAANANRSTYVRAWLGGTDAGIEGSWEWATRETFSYTNWGPNANDRGRNKRDYLVGWIGKSSADTWRDCRNEKRKRKVKCNVGKYVVEYESAAVAAAAATAISPVPLPASLPLIAAGLGLMAFVGRRRKKA